MVAVGCSVQHFPAPAAAAAITWAGVRVNKRRSSPRHAQSRTRGRGSSKAPLHSSASAPNPRPMSPSRLAGFEALARFVFLRGHSTLLLTLPGLTRHPRPPALTAASPATPIPPPSPLPSLLHALLVALCTCATAHHIRCLSDEARSQDCRSPIA